MDSNNYNVLFRSHTMSAHVLINKMESICKECDEHFESFEEYYIHLTSHRGTKYKHNLILEKLYSKINFNGFNDNFIKHAISAHVVINDMTSQSNYCKECNKTFLNDDKYYLHLSKHVKKRDGDMQNERFIKQYECDQCDKRFVQKSTLDAHASVHDPFPHNCHCGVGFYIKADLLRHQELVHPMHFKEELEKLTSRKQRALVNEFWVPKINYSGPKILKVEAESSKPRGPRLKAELVMKSTGKNNHKNGRYSCSDCGKAFPFVTVLKIHERIHTGEKPYGCDLCGKRFTQSGSLRLHLDRHAGIKNCACDICGKEFLGKGNMEIHRRIHTGQKPHKCEYCGKAFSDGSALNRHVRTHSGVKPYACQFCGMKFSDASGRIAHERRHTGKKDFKCDICCKKFYEVHSLRKHVIAVHSGLKKYKCDICPKEFSLKQYLVIHKKNSHLDKSSIKIFECDDSYKNKLKGLKSHFIVQQKSNHTCTVCLKIFKSIRNLRRHHIVVHSEEKNFECHYCGKSFSYKPHLLKHIYSEHLESLYCNICSQPFYSDSELKQHKAKGCQVKLIPCEICNKMLTKKYFKKHLISVHAIQMVECHYCQKKFFGKSSLIEHFKLVHKDVVLK